MSDRARAPDGPGHAEPTDGKGVAAPTYRHHRPGDSDGIGRRRALWWALGLNAVFMVAELIGAAMSGSLALAADAVHMGSDVAALGVALVALRLARRPPTERYTYGWHRADIVGAQFNAVILLAAAVVIAVEAVRRVGEPVDLRGSTVIVVAIAGLVVNVAAAVILARHAGHSLNMRAALWHMASDALGSIAALAAGIAAVAAGAVWVDLVASVAIAALVAVAAWRLLRDSTAIILEAAPTGIDHTDLVATLTAHRAVESVHHLHVWSLDAETIALSAHVVLADQPDLHDAQRVGDELRHLLDEQYGIDHATLEYECHTCEPAQGHDSTCSPDAVVCERTSDPGAAPVTGAS